MPPNFNKAKHPQNQQINGCCFPGAWPSSVCMINCPLTPVLLESLCVLWSPTLCKYVPPMEEGPESVRPTQFCLSPSGSRLPFQETFPDQSFLKPF